MTNPFDWRNQPKKVDWKDIDLAGRISRSMSAHICQQRSSGHEPSLVCDFSAHTAGDPRKYVTYRGKR